MTRHYLGRRLAMGLALGALAGCGFHPLYGSQPNGTAPRRELAAINVELIPDRPGQLLRQALQQRLDQGEGTPKRFSLSVSFGVAGESIGIQRDTSSTRLREVATATWTLKSLDPARTVVTNGTARAVDGVNILDQQYFAADLEGETATRRITETVADEIAQQIASYFARRPKTA